MKTFFLLLISASCITRAAAQAPAISWYTAESSDYYEVSSCRPGSSAAFYSSGSGGRYLGSSIIGADGRTIAPGSKDFRPAMVLSNGKGGNGYVAHTGAREFAVPSPVVQGDGPSASVTWDGAASITGDISFRVLSSTDGVSYKEAAVIGARSGEAMTPYTYTAAWAGAAILYKLEVASKAKGVRYVTQPVLLAGKSAITVFPTTASDYVYIGLPAIADEAAYTIVSNESKVVAGGTLSPHCSLLCHVC